VHEFVAQQAAGVFVGYHNCATAALFVGYEDVLESLSTGSL
jgi:hypothetical protein